MIQLLFSDIHQSVINFICLAVLSGICISLEKKSSFFPSCKEVLSKCFMAADDKSIACNTFLQLISGKKPDATSIQFVKPERRGFDLVGFFFDHYRGGAIQH